MNTNESTQPHRIKSKKPRAERREVIYQRPRNLRRRSQASLPVPWMLSANIIRWHLPASPCQHPTSSGTGERRIQHQSVGHPPPNHSYASQPLGLAAFISHP